MGLIWHVQHSSQIQSTTCICFCCSFPLFRYSEEHIDTADILNSRKSPILPFGFGVHWVILEHLPMYNC